MVILITGAGGFLGSNFCRHLREEYPSVIIYALVRSSLDAQRLEQRGVRAIVGDLTSPDSYAAVLSEVEFVFHLGADASFKEGDYERNNVTGTTTLLESCKGCKKLRRFVLASTIGVLDRSKSDTCNSLLNNASVPHPTSPYGKSKLTTETLVRESGLPFSILRFTWIYGAGMRLDSHIAVLNSMVKKNSLMSRIFFPGRVSTIHVDDCSRIMSSMLTQEWGAGATLLVADPRPISFGELFTHLHAIHGRQNSMMLRLPEALWTSIRILRRFLPFTIRCLVEDVLASEGETVSFTPGFTFKDTKDALIQAFSLPRRGSIIITGAASGIGLAMAKQLSERGESSLILLDRDPSVVQRASELKARAHVIDLSSRSLDTEFVSILSKESNPIEGLVLCAGIGFRGELQDHSIATIFNIVNCNLSSVIASCRMSYKDLKATNGFVVLFASSIAEIPLPGMAVYAASKAGVLSFGKSLWGEWQTKGIRVLTVSPSGTRTSFQQSAGVKVLNEGRGLLDPHDVAKKTIRALYNSSAPLLSWVGLVPTVLSIVGKVSPRSEIFIWKKLFSLLR
jgi:nucleoside-diphosphate-sugar epimerase